MHESSIGSLFDMFRIRFYAVTEVTYAIHADGLHRDALRMLSRDNLNDCTLRNVTDMADWTWIAMIEITFPCPLARVPRGI